ncbi:MAG: L-rhamnose mutarotase [Saprospiraceae bacterium]|jgi:L-rhamnose mutarotase
MQKVAFTMQLKPGFKEEYKRRHDEIWPALSLLLKEAGISDYSIFLDEDTLTLFAVHKLDDNHTSDSLAEKAIMKKWWAYMSDIMKSNADNSPVVNPLNMVFHME